MKLGEEIMAVNPMMLMKIMNLKDKFTQTHPKFEAFVRTVLMGGGIVEGTVIEMTVKKPGEEPVTTNLKVQKSDLELVEEIKNLGKQNV